MSKIKATILRHWKERLSKCSLEPLNGREGFTFIKWTENMTFNASNYLLLTVDAPELSIEDSGYPILLLDSTWKLLENMQKSITGSPIRRSLPKSIQTAYPRVSKIHQDPLGGLASIEALYTAIKLLGHDDPSLLNDYHWKDAFLQQFKA